uniref:Uncharacterized protein n=1 Tax=Solanum tuberosum TaxID=4113 RepID=M1CYQ2_SOLTU
MLVFRGSPLQPLPKPSSENRLSLDPRTDPPSVDRGLLYPAFDANDGQPARTVVRSTVQVLSIQITVRLVPDLQSVESVVQVLSIQITVRSVPDLQSVESMYARDHANKVSLGSLVVLGPVSASRG